MFSNLKYKNAFIYTYFVEQYNLERIWIFLNIQNNKIENKN